MSDKQDIQYNFRLDVKSAAMNLANKVIGQPGMRANYYIDFKRIVGLAIEKRDNDLAELETVQVRRDHLRLLTEWLVKAVKGYDQTDKARADVLGRNPGCFGKNADHHCKRGISPKDALCEACRAISPLLKDDC